MNYKFENFKWNNDVLFIKKSGKDVTLEDINETTPWYFNDYDHSKKAYVPSSTLELSEYGDDDLIYNGRSFKQIVTVVDKIKYAYACFHDDTMVTNVIQEIFPQITEVIAPSKRYTTKYYLPYWMDKYGFTLKDFIINDKYVVLSCTGSANEFWALEESGLIDWENIEYCSEDDEDDTN